MNNRFLHAVLAIVLIEMPFNAISASKENKTDYASISCLTDKQEVICSYKHPRSMKVATLTATINQKKAPILKVKGYPATPEDTTAILILLDTSDPKRMATIKTMAADANSMIKNMKPHQSIGVSVFDNDYRSILPVSKSTQGFAINMPAAGGGQATELYKNILAGIDDLKKAKATRKGIIVLSDGKAEDTAYKIEDVIQAAKQDDIVVMGLGYAERASETPHLQTLKRIAEETGGEYHQIKSGTVTGFPDKFMEAPFSFLETGGQVTINAQGIYGDANVSLHLKTSESTIILESKSAIPDTRSNTEKLRDYVIKWWMYLLPGLAALLFAIYMAVTRIRNKAGARKHKVVYGHLEELDGSGTKHQITNSAVRIGRSPDNDVCLKNDSISGHHAEIYRSKDGSFHIVDLSSTNGVLVNDVKVDRIELMPGDMIELGEVRLRFMC